MQKAQKMQNPTYNIEHAQIIQTCNEILYNTPFKYISNIFHLSCHVVLLDFFFCVHY